ncbi:hypothetical protein CTAYLR_002111 [Chrysophaeum taylorii]|uniref:J domain-containing protein n=1 Tax=Chrysophaeum taylorii TaxID=2483200 RepID=A0AAD7UMG3_9STRA|nr:hypothetical protein CTAYLR_002111 [Chrysophaeum taylorii]
MAEREFSSAPPAIPATLADLQRIIEEGERMIEETRRPDASELERRTRLFGSLSTAEQRRCAAAVRRVLLAARKGYYSVLGVGRRASNAEVKRSYRQKALNVHPDRNLSPLAPEAFDALHEAYETITDPQSKREYDRRLKRKAIVRRNRVRRQFTALVHDTKAFVKFRSSQAPATFYLFLFASFFLLGI